MIFVEIRYVPRELVAAIEARGDPGALCDSGFFSRMFTDAMIRSDRDLSSGRKKQVGVNVHRVAPDDDRLLREVVESRNRTWRDRIDRTTLIGMLGLDQHEIGARIVAALLRDAGIEVIYAGKFNTPEALVNVSVQEAADVIGISAHSWEYLDHVPVLLSLLRQATLATPVVVGGSVITPTDRQTLLGWGVADVFGPETDSSSIAPRIARLSRASTT